MWKFLKILPIKAKIFIILVFIFTIFFGLVFFGIYLESKNYILSNADERMNAHLKDLEDVFLLHKTTQEQHVKQGSSWAQDILEQTGELKENPNKRFITNITNTQKEKVMRVELTEWLLNGKSFHFDTTLVDLISKKIKYEVTIFQIIPQGLVRIATTNRNQAKQRATRTFIENTNTAYKNIVQNQTYQGRIKILDEWNTVYYYPIYSKGKLIGVLGINTPEKELHTLKNIVGKRAYLKTGFGYVMDKDGYVLIHKNKKFEGTNFKQINPKFYNWLMSQKDQAKERYFINTPPSPKYPKGIAEWRWQYFKYFKPYEMYIGIVVPEKEFFGDALNNLIQLMFFAFLVTICGGILLINIMINPIFKPLQQINNTLRDLAVGKGVKPLQVVYFDEVGKITHSLNQVIDALKSYSVFAQEVGKKNFDADFKPLSGEDMLGNVLIEMADKLQENENEVKKRTWIAEGNALLGKVMRQHSGNLEMLFAQTLRNLLEYIQAPQGGIFLLDESNVQNPCLNLVACFAYQKERILQKKMDTQTGFLGQCLQSKKTLIVENLPNGYSELMTGTEKVYPHTLVMIPLRVQNQIKGVMEIFSFKHFLPFEISFLESFAESLTATTVVEQSNYSTRVFLQQMQETAEMLAQQDEEMRQNMEELRTTQELSQSKEKEIEKLLEQSQIKEKTLQENLEEMKKMEVQMYVQRTALEKELDNALKREKTLVAEINLLKSK